MVQLHGGSFHVCAGNIRRNDAVAVQVLARHSFQQLGAFLIIR